MQPDPDHTSAASRRPGNGVSGIVKIVLLYALAAALWILGSDRLVSLFVVDPTHIVVISTLKGLVFVVLTSLLLFALLSRFSTLREKRHSSQGASQPDEAEQKTNANWSDPWRVIAVFLFLTAIMAAIGATAFHFLSGIRHRQINEQLSAVADLKAKQVEDWLEERRLDVQGHIEKSFFSEAFINWRSGGDAGLAERLRSRMDSLRMVYGYVSIELLDMKGRGLLFSGPHHHSGPNMHHQDLLHRTVEEREPIFIDLHKGSDGAVHLVYMMAIEDAKKTAAGVAVFTIDPSIRLFPLIRSWPNASESGETLIVRREGDEVVFLNELRHRENTAVSIRIPMSNMDVPAVQAILHGPGLYKGRDYRGVPVLTSIRPVSGTPWLLVAKIDQEEAHKEIMNLAISSSLLTLAAILISGVLLGQAWRQQRMQEALASAEQKRIIEEERRITVDFLRLVNESGSRDEMIRSAVTFFQQQSGCEAVGIRMKKDGDYPYYEARGFTPEFVLAENSLCSKDDEGNRILDSIGNPVVECMCGNVICGRFDPSKPFFTPQGNFWTNSTTELLATTDETDRQARTRNRCNGEGYESVALIGLGSGGKRIGLLQLNDRRRGHFSPELIARWERLAGYLAVALAKFQAEEEMHSSEQLYRSLFNNMLNGFAYCRMLYDQDRPTDFIYLSVNDAFVTLTGLKEVVGRKVTEVIPGIRQTSPELFEIYGRVALTARPERFETYVAALDMWFSISVYSPKKEHFVAVFDVITERKRAEEALVESERKYRSLVDHALVGVYRSSLEGTFLYVNEAMAKIFECASADEMLAQPVLSRYRRPGERLTFIEGLKDKGMISSYEIGITTGPGKEKTIIISAVLEGEIISGMVMDLTEQKRLEAQLRQAQKMEAIGTLAGGIAHDFNNILSAIVGYGQLLHMKMKADDPLRINVEQILDAADRAATLTHSLLAFSRKQIISVKPVDVNDLLRRVEKFLIRIIGEDISVRTVLGETRMTVMADSSQIEQVLMNLATNARDAMPRGGTFTLETGCVELDESFVERHGYGKPGAYARFSVTDSGVGMDEETRRRIFEPFFTTKELGRGTGLGLALVYGIVKQHDGYIDVYSEPGKGSAFRIYLPLVAGPGEENLRRPEASPPSPLITGGTETILMAEDDPALRKLTRVILEDAGYTLIVAEDGEDAVRKFQEHMDEVRLVILDVIMPRKNGREAYEEIRNIRPDIKAIFASGYTADKVNLEGMLEPGFELLLKPVTPRDLLKKVREVLDRPGREEKA
ncbi:MAG: response regulator [Nitrospirae bacterium]|nr:response regulator [Nitrospirota bacterium]